MAAKLTNKDHRKMDKFLGELFDAVTTKEVSRNNFIGGMAQIMAALDIDNTGEAVQWFKNGVDWFKREDH
jgi:hypothetical protein